MSERGSFLDVTHANEDNRELVNLVEAGAVTAGFVLLKEPPSLVATDLAKLINKYPELRLLQGVINGNPAVVLIAAGGIYGIGVSLPYALWGRLRELEQPGIVGTVREKLGCVPADIEPVSLDALKELSDLGILLAKAVRGLPVPPAAES